MPRIVLITDMAEIESKIIEFIQKGDVYEWEIKKSLPITERKVKQCLKYLTDIGVIVKEGSKYKIGRMINRR